MSTGINTERWRVLVAQNVEEVSQEIFTRIRRMKMRILRS